MRTYKIYLIRHGLTQSNFEGRFVGKTDVDLCEQGIADLIELKNKYEYPNVGRVYTSPLRRAIQTARLIYPEMTPVTVADLQEYDFGEFENKTIAELDGDERFMKWFESEKDVIPNGAEKISNFHKRIVDGLDQVIKDMMKDRLTHAAIVTHGGVIMSLLALCGIPKCSPNEWMVDNGHGYTLLINASLWGNNNAIEVFTPLPYGTDKDKVMLDYQKELTEYE